MSDTDRWLEVERIEDWGESGDITCHVCGRVMHLYFNGGELDGAECCGFYYQTVCPQVDLLVFYDTKQSETTVQPKGEDLS